ncbi:MAG: TRAM domain-containing protein [Verrucomicrobia bacterium]|nr:TRAM domain-containing protein [Verrucomicrobiota bacterium]MBU1909370.1 TRAM domain-containing protein [Verrucomicrobiota bacterium]
MNTPSPQPVESAAPQPPSPQPVESAAPKPPSRRSLWILLAISLVAVLAVLWLVFRPDQVETEKIEVLLEGDAATAAGVYKHDVVDAVGRRDVKAEVGRRYRVRIDDESDKGAAGIAKIGGLVTFVSGARRGEIVIVEVTRVKRSVAEAVRIKTLETVPVSERTRAAPVERSADMPPDPVSVGGRYSGTAKELGKAGDGIIRVEGKVVFVEGARVGERVAFEVTENLGRFARGRVVEAAAGEAPAPVAAEKPVVDSTPLNGASARADDVKAGRVFDVTITEADRRQPDRDGVTKIDGLVIFVVGGRPDQRVRIRIVERMTRFARAEVISRLESATSAPAPEGGP